VKSAFLGVLLPHRDIDWPSPLASELPSSRPTVRPRRFSRPRRFTPPPASRVCFTPQPRPGFSFQGLFPLPSRVTSSMTCPLLSFSDSLLRSSCPSRSGSFRLASRVFFRAAIRGRPPGD
jgi:hypothetical protein